MRISYHISHEQFSPRELLELVKAAERAGFDAAFSSDHLHPWTAQQGESGFIWSWLGAALAATNHLSFAGITVPIGLRYHPVIVAQAIATLGQMFPNRLPWFALGSGEALNESAVARGWPVKAERNALLQEGAQMIRELLEGATVTRNSGLAASNAHIWSRPAQRTSLVIAAMSATTAGCAGTWAEGLLTVGTNLPSLRENVNAFRATGGERPIHAKIDLSWAPTEDEAHRQAQDQWRVQGLPADALQNLRTPAALATAAAAVAPEKLARVALISADLERHVHWLRERAALGLSTLDLHHVGRNQFEFIEAFGAHVLPALRGLNP